jgi:hypothetical protein
MAGMHMPSCRSPRRNFIAAIAALVLSGAAMAEPPSRAARLSYTSGTVSFSPAGQPDWVQAVVNLPLTTGDRLWSDAGSRAELQVGGAAIRLGAATSVTLLNLDDRIAQVQLSQGMLKVRVRRLGPNEAFEVDTPNLAFTLRRPGEYRIDVDQNGDATAVRVLSGQAEVYGEAASYAVNARQGYRFYGTGLSDYESLAPPRDDAFDLWARDRDRRGDNSTSARYVSGDVVGYEDLDASGTWRADPTYGNVWAPTRVAAGWTPYRDGHWAWVDPWGWTWVDDAPWGYAVSHYGRWANIRGSWAWVPGPPRERAVYAPALVAFVGGVGVTVSWFPLAPREVYRPPYAVSRGYFNNINRSNAVIAPAAITNIYNTKNVTNITYANRRVAGAVVAVPAQAFVQSQQVAKAAVAVSKEAAAGAPVANVAAVAPVQQSVHAGAAAGAKPPGRERAFVARSAPPAPPVAFSAQQKELAAKPGAPIDDAQRAQLKPAAPAAAAPKVSVVTTAQVVAPTVAPPATPPGRKTPEARKADAARGDAGRADAAKGDAVKADAAKADAARADAAKTDAAKAGAAKVEAARADAAKADAAKSEAARADAMKAEAAKGAAAKAEASRIDAAKGEAVRAEGARAEAARAAAAKAETARMDAAKAEASRADAVKADAARGAAAKAEASKAEAARAEGARAEAMKAEAARGAAAKAEASRAEAAKGEAARAEGARAEAARAEAAKAAAARAEASRADAAKAEASRAEAARAEAARVTGARAEASRAEAAKGEAAKGEAVRAARAKAAAAREEAAKAEEEKKKPEEEPRKR